MRVVPPAAEFLLLLSEMIDTRRVSRKFLRCQFGSDIVHMRRRCGERGPRTEAEWQAGIRYAQAYMLATNVYVAALWTVLDALPGATTVAAIFTQALASMREALWEGLPTTLATGMNAPSRPSQGSATLTLAGWARTVRFFGSLRGALATQGDPDAVLDSLPGMVYEALHSVQQGSAPSLRAEIRRLVNAIRQESAALSGHLSPESLRKAEHELGQRPPEASAFEDARRRIELEDLVTAWCRRAGLTAYEEDVTRLQLQACSDVEIAEMLRRPVDGVKQAWRRARAKLATVYTPEDLQRLLW
jgi:hypothetical protein